LKLVPVNAIWLQKTSGVQL